MKNNNLIVLILLVSLIGLSIYAFVILPNRIERLRGNINREYINNIDSLKRVIYWSQDSVYCYKDSIYNRDSVITQLRLQQTKIIKSHDKKVDSIRVLDPDLTVEFLSKYLSEINIH